MSIQKIFLTHRYTRIQLNRLIKEEDKPMATATIVIDPGHGGSGLIGGSDGNHAVSVSGVKEKDLTYLLPTT